MNHFLHLLYAFALSFSDLGPGQSPLVWNGRNKGSQRAQLLNGRNKGVQKKNKKSIHIEGGKRRLVMYLFSYKATNWSTRFGDALFLELQSVKLEVSRTSRFFRTCPSVGLARLGSPQRLGKVAGRLQVAGCCSVSQNRVGDTQSWI